MLYLCVSTSLFGIYTPSTLCTFIPSGILNFSSISWFVLNSFALQSYSMQAILPPLSLNIILSSLGISLEPFFISFGSLTVYPHVLNIASLFFSILVVSITYIIPITIAIRIIIANTIIVVFFI